MHIINCFLAIAILAAGSSRAGASGQPSAVRHCFFSFRARLQQALAARDIDAILDVVAPDIRISFGPENGFEAFRREWRVNDPERPLWLERGTVLSLGGYFEKPNAFVAPYTFRCGSAFDDLVVTGHNVNVRAAPSPTAAVLRTLSFAVVRGHARGSGDGRSEVRLPDGRKGFIASQYVRSPIDYRAYFVRFGSSWRMALFVAGD